MIMSDRWITRMAREHAMIEPFEDRQVRKGVISYGVSSYGYDMRVAREFRIFTNVLNSIVDPKEFDPKSFVECEGDVCIVPPNSFALARSVEYFRIPRNVLTVTVGKSTYARCGIITNVTPFEPEWEGFVTLEISNTTPLPAKIYANEGIAQVLFFRGEEEPEVSYKDKGGKYQSQVGVTLPKLCEELGIQGPRIRRSTPSLAQLLDSCVSPSRPTCSSFAVERRHDVVAVHPRDRVDADLLRARLLALAVERAVAEALLVHLRHHPRARGDTAPAGPAAAARGARSSPP